MQITPQNYTKLLSEIRQTIKQTEENLVASVNYEKVKMSWQVGERVEKFLRANLKPSERSNYGKELLVRLSKDTNINERALYQMHAFYKTYKTLPSPEKKLNWTHYRNLISVKDDTKRQLLEDLVVKNDLNSKELGKKVSDSNKKAKKKTYVQTQLRFTRGQLFTYSLTSDGKMDLGFYNFLSSNAVILDAKRRGSRTVKGKTPLFTPSNDGVLESLRDSRMTCKNKSDFTYVARLERVVDGDTLHVLLDLGFGLEHREILRLSKIDAAEADTKEGKKASRFLQKTLRDVPFLVIRTNKTDIYGRYVADVFFDKKEMNPRIVAEKGVYLNQLLLDKGLVRMWK